MDHNLFCIAIFGPTLFFVTALILGAITPRYRALHNTISELALSKHSLAHAVNYVLCGSLITLLGLLSISKHSHTYGAVAIVIMGVALLLSAVFRTDPISANGSTVEGKIHNTLFFVAMLGVISGQFVTGISARGSALGVFSLLCGIWTICFLPITITRRTYMGLFQRLLVAVVMLWITGFALSVWGW